MSILKKKGLIHHLRSALHRPQLWALPVLGLVLVTSCKGTGPGLATAADQGASSTSAVDAADRSRGAISLCQLMHLSPCTETPYGPAITLVSGRSGIVESRITETRDGKGRSTYMIVDQWRVHYTNDQGQKAYEEKGCSILASGPSRTGFEIPGNPMSAYFAPHNRVMQDPRFKIETPCPNPN